MGTTGRATAANMKIGGTVETDEEAKRKANLESAAKAAAAFGREQKIKAGGASPTFKMQVPPQADDEIPVVLKKKRPVNQNKPSEPF